MWVTVGWVGIEVQIAFFIGGAYEMMPLKTWTRVCVKMDLDLDLDLGLGSAIRADPGDDHPKGRGARACCHLSQLVSDDRRRRTCCVISAACMDGAHAKQRVTAEAVYADKQEAAAKRQGVQHGVAASGRKGQATSIRAASNGTVPKAVQDEVARAMKSSSALVQASLEHLETAERSWEKWLSENNIVVKRYPTEVQVLSYMSQMSRTRQRECLAQRGTCRKGNQKSSVRNYVAEMGNNLWVRKYPAFAKIDPVKQKQYWSTIFTAYGAMYKSASQAKDSKEDEERAEQLVAQVLSRRGAAVTFAGKRIASHGDWCAASCRRPRKFTNESTRTGRRFSSCKTISSERKGMSIERLLGMQQWRSCRVQLRG